MHAETRDAQALTPLPYHREIVAHLKASEPDVWAWASSLRVRDEHAQTVRAQLLRETYRLTPGSHPDVYDTCTTALARLGIDATVTLYQAGASTMNATLHFLPGEVHVMLQGPILDRLNALERLAVFGHELAHYRLWSADDGDYFTADRILNYSAGSPDVPPSFAASARLFALYTELYADRGAALAAQSSAAAIATLVKVHTGSAIVDPSAYLQQALELDTPDGKRSEGVSHPETFLRSQAVDMWWHAHAELDAWLQRRLRGPLNLATLDLTDQVALTALTRDAISRYLASTSHTSERKRAQAQTFFPDWTPAPRDMAALTPDRVDPNVQEYLNYVVLDLVMCEQDGREAALAHALRTAHTWGGRDDMLTLLKRDLKMNKRQLDKLQRMAAEASPA